MNYQHAYHAAGFSDVLKHTILVLLINALQKKTGHFALSTPTLDWGSII